LAQIIHRSFPYEAEVPATRYCRAAAQRGRRVLPQRRTVKVDLVFAELHGCEGRVRRRRPPVLGNSEPEVPIELHGAIDVSDRYGDVIKPGYWHR
jgi:hypothetical protein